MAVKDTRGRNFATVVYPESAPTNWLDILSELKVPVMVSPLHDKDVNPTGEPKKPHYHVMIMFEGKKSDEQVKDILVSFGGVGLEKVQSLRGYARYLCHMDNPEKYQYKLEDVRCFGGCDYVSAIGLPTDKYKALDEMMSFCNEFNVICYADLVDYARNNRYDWFRVLADSGSVMMKEYLKSKYWMNERIREEEKQAREARENR